MSKKSKPPMSLEEFSKPKVVEAEQSDSESFLKKFSADITKPVETQEFPVKGKEAPEVDLEKADEGEVPDEPEKPRSEAPVRKQGYTAQQEAKRKEAEKRAKELEDEAVKYRDVEIPKLQSTIDDLTKKLEDSDSKKESAALQARIDELQKEKDAYAGTAEKAKELETRMEYLDLENSPAFIKTYREPLIGIRNQANKIIGANPQLHQRLTEALGANLAEMMAQTPEEAQIARTARQEALGQIYENLPPMDQGMFVQTVNQMFVKQEEYQTALMRGAQTNKELTVKAQLAQQEEQARIARVWQSAYDDAEVTVQYEKPIEDIIKGQKIDDDITEDEKIALATLKDGGNSYAPKEIMRIVQQGKVFKKNQAIIKAQDHLIKELQQTIAKYKGSGTQSENGHKPPANGSKPDAETSRKSFMQKFAPPVGAGR